MLQLILPNDHIVAHFASQFVPAPTQLNLAKQGEVKHSW
jgi:hypothetical protein